MKVFLSYLRRHLAVLIFFALAMGSFACVFALYSLPVEAVVYAVMLALFFLVVIGGIRGWAYLKKHHMLSELKGRIGIELTGLPETADIIERDYIELLRILSDEKKAVSMESEKHQRETMDYYSLWVHQIKTPLSAARLLLQSEGGNRDEELMAELTKIEQYVEMVLGYQRLSSDYTDYLIKEYPLDEIIRRSIRKYARLFVLKKLALDFRETGLTVLTDEKWLAFAIEQILSNALKYTMQGGITIWAEGETLYIKDTGIGIRPEDLPRAFEKGFTGYNGREDKKSTGIGLYLCSGTLRQLGHSLCINSEPGEGTEVQIGFDRKKLFFD